MLEGSRQSAVQDQHGLVTRLSILIWYWYWVDQAQPERSIALKPAHRGATACRAIRAYQRSKLRTTTNSTTRLISPEATSQPVEAIAGKKTWEEQIPSKLDQRQTKPWHQDDVKQWDINNGLNDYRHSIAHSFQRGVDMVISFS